MPAGQARSLGRSFRCAVRRRHRRNDQYTPGDRARDRHLSPAVSRAKTLAVRPAQKPRSGARLEPEPAAVRLHQRRQRAAKSLGIAACDGAEAVVAGIALTECQETKSKPDPGGLVAGTDDEVTAKKIGGRLAFAILLKRLCDAEQRVGGVGHDGERPCKG